MALRVGGLELRPFVLGWPRFVEAWVERSPIEGTVLVDVLADESRTFFRLLNAGNALAFPDIPMPDWVQLGCATLPSAMVGFALPRAQVPADLWQRLEASHGALFDEEIGGYDGLVPVSAWCGLMTPEAGTVSGISFFTLIPGLGIGLRSKALALLLMGARTQIGITAREGPVRRRHETLGPLQVVRDRPAAHPQGADRVVYELEVPEAAVLEQIVRTGRGVGSRHS